MYLAIDIGGTKTFVASIDDAGVITERLRFPTPKEYASFKKELASSVAQLTTKEFSAAGVGAPGLIDHAHRIALTMGNLPWKRAPIRADVADIAKCEQVALGNDAKLACLSEAMLLKDQYRTVLYVTIGTGIGMGITVDQKIILPHAEPGHMMLEFEGRFQKWESFASGRAIAARFGKPARDITDEATWEHISHALTIGFNHLIAIVQPDVIVLGGGVSAHFDRFGAPLSKELKRFETPMTPVPPIIGAQRPEEAVLFGCYDLARSTYGPTAQPA